MVRRVEDSHGFPIQLPVTGGKKKVFNIPRAMKQLEGVKVPGALTARAKALSDGELSTHLPIGRIVKRILEGNG